MKLAYESKSFDSFVVNNRERPLNIRVCTLL